MATEPIDIHVQDAALNPVDEVNVIVWQSDGVTPVAGGFTDSGGDLSLTVPVPGGYLVRVARAGVISATHSIAVPDTGGLGPATQFDLDVVVYTTPTAPARPEVTLLYGYVVDSAGLPLSTRIVVESVATTGAGAFVVPSSGGSGVDTANTLQVPTTRELLSNADGYWEVVVLQGTRVSVRIPAAGISKVFYVPADPTVNLRDLRSTPGHEDLGAVDNSSTSVL